MLLTDMHREDVKAALRKRFGSIAEFERQRELPTKSVNEVLRGRPNARVAEAIQNAITESASTSVQPEVSGNTRKRKAVHRLNAEAR